MCLSNHCLQILFVYIMISLIPAEQFGRCTARTAVRKKNLV